MFSSRLLLLQMIGAYCVSKTALLGLTKVMASELAEKNIRVNGVAPGIIRTKFSEFVRQFNLPSIVSNSSVSMLYFCSALERRRTHLESRQEHHPNETVCRTCSQDRYFPLWRTYYCPFQGSEKPTRLLALCLSWHPMPLLT